MGRCGLLIVFNLTIKESLSSNFVMSRHGRSASCRATLDRLEPRRLLALAVSGVEVTTDIEPRDGIEVAFNGPFESASIGNEDVRVENLTTGGGALAELIPSSVATNRVRLTFADAEYLDQGVGPVRLPDGYYELSLLADGIKDPAGGKLMASASGTEFADGRYTSGNELWFLNGDFNRDGTVDLADFGILRAGMGTGTTFGQGDANGDGTVNLADFGIQRAQHGRTLEAPPTEAGEVLATLSTSSTIELSWVLPSSSVDRPNAWHLFRGTGNGIDYGSEPVAILSNTDAEPANDFTEVFGSDGVLRGYVTDAGLMDGAQYRYDLRAWSATTGLSPSTDTAEEWTQLVVPSNLTAGFDEDGSVLLEWTLDGYGASHNVIRYRTSPAGPWLPGAEVHGLDSRWVVEGLPGTLAEIADYEFQVKSELRDDGIVLRDTLFTDPIEAGLATPLYADAAAVNPHVSNDVEVTWTRGGNAQSLHRLEVSSDGVANWQAPPTGDTALAFGEDRTLAGLADDATYSVRVRSKLFVYSHPYDQVGTLLEASDWTVIQDVEVPVLSPRDINAIAVGDGTIRVEWSDVSVAETGYTVERRETSGVVWTQVGATGSGATSVIDTTPGSDNEFVYRVTTDTPTTQPGDPTSEDENTVAKADADEEHVGDGGWAGQVIEAPDGFGGSVTARANEMNDPHGWVRIIAGTQTTVFPYEELQNPNLDQRSELLTFANGLVGLSIKEEVRVDGEAAWTKTTTVSGTVVSVDTPEEYRVDLVLEPATETPHGDPVMLPDGPLNRFMLFVPHSGDSASVTVEASGSLVEALEDYEGTIPWSNASKFYALARAGIFSIQPAEAILSAGDAGVFVNDSRVDVEDEEVDIRVRVKTPSGDDASGVAVFIREIVLLYDEETKTRAFVRFDQHSVTTNQNGIAKFTAKSLIAGPTMVTFATEKGGERTININVEPLHSNKQWDVARVVDQLGRSLDTAKEGVLSQVPVIFRPAVDKAYSVFRSGLGATFSLRDVVYKYGLDDERFPDARLPTVQNIFENLQGAGVLFYLDVSVRQPSLNIRHTKKNMLFDVGVGVTIDGSIIGFGGLIQVYLQVPRVIEASIHANDGVIEPTISV